MTFNMLIASVAWLLLVVGYLNRFNRTRHVPLALMGIALDIGLVGYLQVKKQAVQTALEFSLGPFEQVHILFSTISLLLYFPVVLMGGLVLCGKTEWLVWHGRIAKVTLIFRTLGFLFMFSMWK